MKHWTLGELESIPNSITTLDIGLKGLTYLQTNAKAKNSLTPAQQDISLNLKGTDTLDKGEGNLYIMDSSRKSRAEIRIIF